jgi:hypothetical protein
LDNYIPLERTFSLLRTPSSDKSLSEEDFEQTTSFSWEDLRSHDRVVILAEAGAGKTTEIKMQVTTLRNEGHDAFFLVLENLKDEFEFAFHPIWGPFGDFNAWKNTYRTGYFFLDSVDEAKMNCERDFRKAITRFAKHLSPYMSRIKIVITSRIAAWKPTSDLRDITELLGNGSSCKLSNISTNDNDDGKTPFTVVALDSLSHRQIESFASKRNVSNISGFLASLEKHDSFSFATRPLDLEELLDYWIKHQSIGCRRDLVTNSIEMKLTQIESGRDKVSLDYHESLEGTRWLAAGTFFCQQPDILNIDVSSSIDGLNPAALLPTWSSDKIATLLDRAIFQLSKYGTVRFFNIFAREYLTAQLLWDLKENEVLTLDELKGYFFNKIYGEIVPRKSLKAVLGWYLTFDNSLFDYSLEYAPEAFLQGGDPSILSLDNRQSVLSYYCKELATTLSGAHIHWDNHAIHRFASPELAPFVLSLLEDYRFFPDVCEFLMRLAATCGSDIFINIARSIVLDDNMTIYVVKNSLEYLNNQLNESAFKQIIAELLAKEPSQRIIETVLYSYPNDCDFEALMSSVQLTLSKAKGSSTKLSLRQSINRYTKRLDNNQLVGVFKHIYSKITLVPYSNNYGSLISKEYEWFIEAALNTVIRLIDIRHEYCLERDFVDALHRLQSNSNYHFTASNEQKELSTLVVLWPELNQLLFWYMIANTRAAYEAEGEGKRVKYWRVGRGTNMFWTFTVSDLDSILDWIEQKNDDDQLVALSLAFKVCKDSETDYDVNIQLIQNKVSHNLELSEFFNEFINPPVPEWELKYQEEQKEWDQERRELEEQELINKKDWFDYITQNLDVITDISHAESGLYNGTQNHLIRCILKCSDTGGSHSLDNWKILENEFNIVVLQRFEDAAKKYWRAFRGTIHRNGNEIPNTRSGSFIFAHTGLAIEASTVDYWVQALTDDEVIQATKFAISELNQFPIWMKDLIENRTMLVLRVLADELEWELSTIHDKNVYLMHKIRYSDTSLHKCITPHIIEILCRNEVRNSSLLKYAFEVCLAHCSSQAELLSALATDRCRMAISVEEKAIWLSLMLYLEPQSGLIEFKEALDSDNMNATELVMRTLTSRQNSVISQLSYESDDALYLNFTDEQYCSFVELIYDYVRVEEDIDRTSGECYSPTIRDDAQKTRNQLLSTVGKLSGPSVVELLKKLEYKAANTTNMAEYFSQLRKDVILRDGDWKAWSLQEFSNLMKKKIKSRGSVHIDKSINVNYGEGNSFVENSGNVNSSPSTGEAPSRILSWVVGLITCVAGVFTILQYYQD